MTAARYQELLAGAEPVSENERSEFEKLKAWQRRSDAAKQAVETKRRKYAQWPCNRKE